YVALSHCWGGDVHCKTESSNFHQHLEAIQFSEFPKTFQDAITICRLLKVENLWIDSLCIIQDSAEDWAEQAARMSHVYANAFVTISADGAADSSQGGYDAFQHHSWASSLSSPLSNRGWVLQEIVLSPRILRFMAEELTWECSTTSQCECQCLPHTAEFEQFLKACIDDTSFDRCWSSLVDEYTDRQLSYWSDPLPATSGIVQQLAMSQPASLVYYAGLWSKSFPECMLWRTLDRDRDGTKSASDRIKPYHAPTWSWASVTGRI
ncbi:HET-domain-containing protein, partial [Setomelanomma holmii]